MGLTFLFFLPLPEIFVANEGGGYSAILGKVFQDAFTQVVAGTDPVLPLDLSGLRCAPTDVDFMIGRRFIEMFFGCLNTIPSSPRLPVGVDTSLVNGAVTEGFFNGAPGPPTAHGAVKTDPRHDLIFVADRTADRVLVYSVSDITLGTSLQLQLSPTNSFSVGHNPGSFPNGIALMYPE